MLARLHSILIIFFILGLIPAITSAQTAYGGRTCSATNAGQIIWDYNDVFDLDMQFCDGTSQWFSLLTVTNGACAAGDAGKMYWNALGYYEYCNGTNLINTQGKLTADTCTNQQVGKMRWSASNAALQSCYGSGSSYFYYNMGPTTEIFTTSRSWTVPTYATAIRISVWGAGGGGGDSQTTTINNGTAGTASTAVLPAPISFTITGNGGAGGTGGVTANGGGPGGAGGTASGDASTTVQSGGNGVAGEVVATVGGDGGAAFKGGKAGSNSGPKGTNGLTPGGGGAGKSATGGRKAGGGGGAGGYASRVFNDTSLIGLSITVTIGVGGLGHITGSTNGNGGAGKVVITYW